MDASSFLKDSDDPTDNKFQQKNKISKVYNCAVCDAEFKYKTSMDRHMRVHEGKRYICNICYAVYTTRHSLRIHNRKHTGAPHICKICHRSFKIHSHLSLHRHVHSDIGDQDEASRKSETSSRYLDINQVYNDQLKQNNSFPVHS